MAAKAIPSQITDMLKKKGYRPEAHIYELFHTHQSLDAAAKAKGISLQEANRLLMRAYNALPAAAMEVLQVRL